MSVTEASVEPQHACVACCSTITGTEHVKYDICDGKFHVDCSGIPAAVQQTFLQIAESVGWTCCQCRSTARMTMHKFQAGLIELTVSIIN